VLGVFVWSVFLRSSTSALGSLFRLFCVFAYPFTGSLFFTLPFPSSPSISSTPLHVSISIPTVYPHTAYRGPLIQARSISWISYPKFFTITLIVLLPLLPLPAPFPFSLYSTSTLSLSPQGTAPQKVHISGKTFSPSASSIILPWAVLFWRVFIELLLIFAFSFFSLSFLITLCPGPSHVVRAYVFPAVPVI
jgi:hypothetical protein